MRREADDNILSKSESGSMLGSSSIWEELYLGNIANIVVGYVGNVNNYYTDIDGIPFYRTQNVRSGRFSHLNLEYVTKEFHMKNKKSSIKNGDILIARVGANLGMVAKVDGLKGEANSANVIIIRPNKDLDSDYCSFFLNSAFGQNQIFGGAVGGAQGVFNTGSAQKIRIPLPPLPEQRRIAAILSQWDDSLSILTKLIEAKRQQKRGLAEQLLTGKRRLKGFEGKWIKGPLSSLGKVIRGVSYKPEDLQESVSSESSYLLRSSNIQNSLINLENSYVVNSKRVSEKQVLLDGDIVICMANGSKNLVGKSGVFRYTGFDKYTVGAFCAIIRPNSKLEGSYTYQLMQTSTYEEAIALGLSGSSINNLKNSDVEEIIFNLPTDHHEQRAIASILSTLDDEIATLNALKAKVQEQKRGLMDLLLTGQVRVKVEEAS